MKNQLLLNDCLTAHFAPVPLEELVVRRCDLPHWMRPDLQRGLDTLFAALPEHRFVGGRMRGHDLEFCFADLLEKGTGGVAIAPVVWQDVDIGEDTPVRCVTRGLWLAEREGVRFAILVDVSEGYHRVRARVEIAVAPGDERESFAVRLLQELRASAESGASWRGKVLVIEPPRDEFELAAAGPRVERTVPVRREDIVLRDDTISLIERNTIGFAERADQLVALGLSARKGVLLYGPPGTGKTLIVRWLAGALENYTKLVVTAGHYGLLAETLSIARVLQPAMIVLEDVDLVGGDRSGPWAGPGNVLNMLLNEMDGLPREAQMIFVLTTNRPEVLEPALAARPGRVDQAIEIGLPEEPERRLLVQRYAGRLDVGEKDAAHVAWRIGRVSPAFIKELMRRAAQAMLDRGGIGVVESCDMDAALHDMLAKGGGTAARVLGADSRIGFTADAIG